VRPAEIEIKTAAERNSCIGFAPRKTNSEGAMTNLEQMIDAVLMREVASGEPGAVVAIVRDGEIAQCKAIGLANVEWNTPLVPEAVFHIASLTKQFTAVAVMMLVERGEISLDAPMDEYLADFPTQGRRVTVRHLLNHTSGIKSYSTLPNFYRDAARLHTPLAGLLSRIAGQPFDFEPGERYAYNNSGYVLLGAITERVSGLKYRDFLKQKIFDPLGMTRTSYLFDEPLVPNRVAGYQRGRGGLENASFISSTCYHAAGGLGSTVFDLATWDGAIRNNLVIKAETLEQMLQPTSLNGGSVYPYGFGWGLGEYRGRRVFHHTVGRNGFGSHMLQFRDFNTATIVLSNLYLFPFDRVTRGLARCVLGEDLSNPTPLSLTKEEAEAFTGKFESAGFAREIVHSGTGLALGRTMLPASGTLRETFAERDRPKLVRVSESLFIEEGDPEIEYQFRDSRGRRYWAIEVRSPLWPTVTYRRTAG
jgi:CubicO group peptidase (beta-lactamase class C family)